MNLYLDYINQNSNSLSFRPGSIMYIKALYNINITLKNVSLFNY